MNTRYPHFLSPAVWPSRKRGWGRDSAEFETCPTRRRLRTKVGAYGEMRGEWRRHPSGFWLAQICSPSTAVSSHLYETFSFSLSLSRFFQFFPSLSYFFAFRFHPIFFLGLFALFDIILSLICFSVSQVKFALLMDWRVAIWEPLGCRWNRETTAH